MRHLAFIGTLLVALPAVAAPSHYWQLGHGAYAPYLANAVETCGELDLARWDWLVVEIGSEDTIRHMNRLLEINPKLRFLARVWPINSIGPADYAVGQGKCLDYQLYPEKRAEVDRRLRESIRQLRQKITNWDSIVCFTFLEEIPAAWGCGELTRYNGEGPLPRLLELHKPAIEKATGRPLVWDNDTKRWIGRQFIESMDSLHRIIKDESGGKLVFYWPHTNFATMDDLPEPLPEDFDLVKWNGFPVYFKEIVKPGLCDGFMAYPNNAKIFEEKYLRHVRGNNWLFYSQLSHPSFMRLCSWPESLQMVTTKLPQNLGYFLYCEGSCSARGVWNDDDSMPRDPAWHQRSISHPLHLRHVAKQFNVGLDVVRRYNHLRVSLDAKIPAAPKPGHVFHCVALIENPKDATYYHDPAEAVARDVRLKLTLPPGVVNDPKISAASALKLGDLPAGGRRLADWWLTIQDPAALQAGKPLTVAVTSPNSDPGQAETCTDVAFPSLQPHPISLSGTTWTENGFRHGGVQPLIHLQASGEPIKNPTLSDGRNTLTYNGELWAGMKLLITPDLKARLYPANLIPPVDDLKDAADPTGYKSFVDGYGVHALSIGKYVRPGAKYRLTISGQAADGAQSLVVLRAPRANREIWQESFLANRFKAAWSQASQDLTIPPDVTSLQRLYFYRFNTKGRVWYGPASLVPADLPAEGLDVSDRLAGRILQITPGMINDFTYTDQSPDSVKPKIIVTLHHPNAAQAQEIQQGF